MHAIQSFFFFIIQSCFLQWREERLTSLEGVTVQESLYIKILNAPSLQRKSLLRQARALGRSKVELGGSVLSTGLVFTLGVVIQQHIFPLLFS